MDGQTMPQIWGQANLKTFKNDAGTLTCDLEYTADIRLLAGASSKAVYFRNLTLTLKVDPKGKELWERSCTGAPDGTLLEYQWQERYYYSGFRTYGHPDTVLSVRGGTSVSLAWLMNLLHRESLCSPMGVASAFCLGMVFAGLLFRRPVKSKNGV